jgi:hypothetical protein
VEEEDLNAEIFLIWSNFLSRIEFSPLVYVFATAQAFHGKGSHESDGLDSWPGGLGSSAATDIIGIEIRGVVLLKDFTLRHFGLEAFISSLRGRKAKEQSDGSKQGVCEERSRWSGVDAATINVDIQVEIRLR